MYAWYSFISCRGRNLAAMHMDGPSCWYRPSGLTRFQVITLDCGLGRMQWSQSFSQTIQIQWQTFASVSSQFLVFNAGCDNAVCQVRHSRRPGYIRFAWYGVPAWLRMEHAHLRRNKNVTLSRAASMLLVAAKFPSGKVSTLCFGAFCMQPLISNHLRY